ncbi:hypothetical protein [Planomonospora parontospora]|uniref:hypothetical protein n=1 Tax=Planomonospora parontospora TaxID=58119 RepID=UPI0016708205|nr:hypothetical protein [Planomonospora parontospora]GGL50467.1 hypothetical protein GCM10014719_59690 [Planomonospora parontospora subsp. antibiotica]GII18987.1 hypothetical protein Ppa05_57130 [Planomonospora parontospora subsp. antibiotica]
MSKTDKTRPWWVRMADAPMVTCVPVHDHRFGSCTLPDEITADSASLNHCTSGCHWRATAYYVFDCGGVGGGREGYHLRRQERRRSRHQARCELHTWHDED